MKAPASVERSLRISPDAPAPGTKGNWLWPALSCAALLVSILIANPFNESGFTDDWSYGRVAMKLAETGRMHYNGWGSPILLFQSFWAIPWIQWFGFSFPLLQVSMIPVSMGFVLLVYATGRAIGLNAELSAFASIATGTSPLFLPLAASFMTDVPGCFFCMLCIYAAIRGAKAEGSSGASTWLWVMTLAGLVGGANRQIVWIAPIVLIPYLVWIRRGNARLVWIRRGNARFRTHAIAAYAVSGVAVLCILHFFAQPYGPLEMGAGPLAAVLSREWPRAITLCVNLVLVCVFVSMPVYCCLLPLIPRRPVSRPILGFTAVAIATLCVLSVASVGAPYGNHILTWVGVATQGQEWFWLKPRILPVWICVVLSILVNVCVVVSVRRAPVGRVPGIFAVFSLGYMALILPGAALELAFDRYMLPIVPLLMLGILLQFAPHRRHVPVVAWCCLLLFAGYGMATTHDYFAALRARIAAAHALERDGIERTRISAAVEYDGWTELERSEYVRVVQYDDQFAEDYNKGFWFWFWDHTPHLRPDFVVLNWNSEAPVRGGEMKIDFHAWLPPFHRSAVVWRRSDLTGALQAARITALLR